MKILASSILTFFLTFSFNSLISAESTDLEEDSSTVEEVVVLVNMRRQTIQLV